MLQEREQLSKTGTLLQLMKKYGVSFDLDGVKCATSYGAIRSYNEKFGAKYNLQRSVGDLSHYYAMTDWLTQIKIMDPDALDDPMEQAISIWNNDDNLKNAPVESGVVALLRLLYSHQIDPYDLTSRPNYTRNATEYWIRTKLEQFGDLTTRLHMQEGSNLNPAFKADRAEELRVLFHFEDSGDHAEKIAARGIIVGLVIQPWSEDFVAENPLIVRPTKYQDRPAIIRTFLTLSDFISENPSLIETLTKSRQN